MNWYSLLGLVVGWYSFDLVKRIRSRDRRMKFEAAIRESMHKERWADYELTDIHWEDDAHIIVNVSKKEQP